jgi:hypothetical protein
VACGNRVGIWLVRRLATAGTTVLLTTQYLDEAGQLSSARALTAILAHRMPCASITSPLAKRPVSK